MFLTLHFADEWVIVAIIAWVVGVIIIGKQINDIILCGTLPEKILLNYIQTN